MPYYAQRTGQITPVNDRRPNGLKEHEAGDDGGTLCHDAMRDWNGMKSCSLSRARASLPA